jgi:hypothetical protein
VKYTYAYKTPDGARHEDSMEAKCREDVFLALRGRGIKAIKVVAADGSKENGEARRGRMARLPLVAVAVLLAALGMVALSNRRGGGQSRADADEAGDNAAPRHQIYGDPAVVNGFEHGEFAPVFDREGDRLLARFAQPGRIMCAKGTDGRILGAAESAAFAAYAAADLGPERDVVVDDADSREVRELKQIVNGMREEMREYLANGNGTPRSYWRRLNERTAEEAKIYERTRFELENEKSPDAWERKNDALRRIGLRTIPNPNE